MVLPTTPFVKALVRWATGERLTNRLPKLSLITYTGVCNTLLRGSDVGQNVTVMLGCYV